MFTRFAMIHERDVRTDRQTPHHSIYRAHAYGSRGENRTSTDHYTAVRWLVHWLSYLVQRGGPGPRLVLSSLYQMWQPTHQRSVYQLHLFDVAL